MYDYFVNSVLSLEKYILEQNFQGYDRYDGLMSPLFKIPLFKNRTFRFYFQQVTKRLPFNFRPLLGIKKSTNPVTLGLCLQAFTYLSKALPEKEKFYQDKIEYLLDELERSKASGYSGACWGYDFDWEARYVTIPAFMPTIVATGIITNGLFEHYRLTGDERSFALCQSAVQFMLNDLNRTHDGEQFCFSYSPADQQVVFNATMKGARLLAQVYSVTEQKELLEAAKSTVSFVMKHQRKDGAWVYALKDNREWVDNYHTGYILDSLMDYIRYSGDTTFQPHLKAGIQYYTDHFFEQNRVPRFYDHKTFPVDCTAAAQSILTLIHANRLETARKVAGWVVAHMQDKAGYFYYRKFRFFTSKLSFMRWSNAWMFVALAKLIYSEKKAA